ncbi:MAG: hypothetical protein KDA33_09515, partial [Phycisphaerales bacterium]|nr:hypothetical protein [Phycisphaerales bacterium]
RWTFPTPTTSAPLNLGLLPAQGSSYGVGISDDGNVIVGYSASVIGKGFRWAQAPAPNPGLNDLGLMAGGTYLVGRQVSGNGQVIIGWGDTTSNLDPAFPTNKMAYRWTSLNGGTFYPLGTIGGPTSTAVGVSWDGSVICGHSQDPLGNEMAFRWQNDVMQNLGVLPNGDFSKGFAMSQDGAVIAGQANVGGTQYNNLHAFRWKDGVMQDLGFLSPNTNGTAVYGANADGSVLVGESGHFRAMLWTQALGMVNLESLLSSLGVDLTGWILNDARAVSPDGLTIVGNGSFNGAQRGWRVKVPYLQLPTVVTHPVSQTACLPTDVTFTADITANGGGLLSVNWRKDGVGLSDGPTGFGSTIVGADTPTLTIQGVTPSDAGQYDYVGTNFYGTATTNAAQLDVVTPAIGTFGPFDTEVCEGGDATLSFGVVPMDAGPCTYQWRRGFGPNPVMTPLPDGPTGNGSVVSGATTTYLVIANTSAQDIATYDCVVTSTGCGDIYSTTAVLTVHPGGTGDGDLNSMTNALDIPGFMAILLNGGSPSASYCAYDMNGDGVVDFDDLPGFLAAVLQ